MPAYSNFDALPPLPPLPAPWILINYLFGQYQLLDDIY